MILIKCKICGGDMSLSADKTYGMCEYCGNTMTLPKIDEEVRAAAFNRGNHFRRTGEFDKALQVYEKIVEEDPNDAEAHWCCALCRFGIEWVEDPATMEYIPTCHRASFDPFTEDVDCKAAIELSEGLTKRQYQKDAARISEIQKGILATSQNEEPFDVFICYKESDDNGNRTIDSTLAQDVYYQLTDQGLRTFFARITLEDKAGSEYEPYIFAALNSAKAMVVIGTKPEHFNAVWVKNEWSRYLAIVKRDRSKVLLPCYRDMDPYDLPEQLSILQSYDMSKIGFMQDLIRGIKKITQADEPKTTIKETVVVNGSNTGVAPLLKRAFMYLEDGEWQNANEYCERVLDQDPENAQAYIGKLMAEKYVRRQDELADCALPFNESNNFKKAIRFGDEKVAFALNEYIKHINERNENTRLTGIYNNAVNAMNDADTEIAFISVAKTFESILGFKDADALAKQSREKAEIYRKDAIYSTGIRSMNAGQGISGYEAAIKTFGTISGWKDTDEQIYACQRKIEEIKAREKAQQLERERQAEQRRIAAEKAAEKRKKVVAIVTPILVACIAFVIVLITVIIPNGKYNAAIDLYNAGKYDEAITAFKELNGYKDSASQITKCETAINDAKYNAAADLYNAGKYDEAITAFKELNGYKDSNAQIEKCEATIKDEKYTAAVELYTAGKYEEAIAAFTALDGYKDSNAQIEKCETTIKDEKYTAAVELYTAGKYEEAIAAFTALDGYKDSREKIDEYYMQISNASVGATIFFGSYEQDNNTSNGKEDIEWIVLARESERVLVISRYGLDCQQYNTSYTSITWETCSLRKWLNGTFLTDAFSENERDMIPSVMVTADKNPSFNTSSGNSTTDQVFLLSISEADKYFNSNSARRCRGTVYCCAQDAYKVSDDHHWWLRTPGGSSNRAASVSLGGSVFDYGLGVDIDGGVVRPALWIDFGA